MLMQISLARFRPHKCHILSCPKEWRQAYVYHYDAANETPQGNAKQLKSVTQLPVGCNHYTIFLNCIRVHPPQYLFGSIFLCFILQGIVTSVSLRHGSKDTARKSPHGWLGRLSTQSRERPHFGWESPERARVPRLPRQSDRRSSRPVWRQEAGYGQGKYRQCVP